MPGSITSGERADFARYEAVAAALQPYLDGARTGVTDGLRRLFYDHARIVGAIEGHFMANDPDAFTEWAGGNGASPALKARITDVQISGPAASVRIEVIDWLGFRFTDFMLLYRQDGIWRVSGKVFDAHGRN